MKLLFVILAYKESPFLEMCVRSVVRQCDGEKIGAVIFTTTPNKMILEVAGRYGLEVKTGEHTTIGGDFDAAVACGKEMGAELVTVAHQDDVYERDYAGEVIDAFSENGQAQMIFTDYFEIKNGEKEVSNRNLRVKRVLVKPLKFKVFSGRKWAKRFALRFGNAICCPAVTLNVDKVKLPLFECPEMKCNVDWVAWERLSRERGRFVFVPRKLMGHRVHEGSTTTETIAGEGGQGRSREDYEMFRKFWGEKTARRLTGVYKKSEENNKI